MAIARATKTNVFRFLFEIMTTPSQICSTNFRTGRLVVRTESKRSNHVFLSEGTIAYFWKQNDGAQNEETRLRQASKMAVRDKLEPSLLSQQ